MNIEDKELYTKKFFGFDSEDSDVLYKENNKKCVSFIINELIKKYYFTSYLEIGICHGHNIRRINIKEKIGIDPAPYPEGEEYTTHLTTSDDYFENIIEKDKKFDIVFIDGDHNGVQVYKDIVNSLEHLDDNGIILLHDMNPLFIDFATDYWQGGIWNGSSWKAMVEARRTISGIKCWTIRDADFGIGIIVKRPNEDNRIDFKPFNELTYADFASRGHFLLNFISHDYFINNIFPEITKKKILKQSFQKDDIKPLVTITITCYNKGEYIKRCIDSVKEQTYSNYECIVINNGSTDNSEEIIKNEIDGFNKFKLISQENKGACNSRTTSAFAGIGKYLIQIDGDDCIGEDFLDYAVYVMENTNADIVYGNIEVSNRNNEKISPYIVTDDNNEINDSIFYFNPFHITSLCKLDAFKEIGGFLPEEEEITEDWSMWLRYTRKYNHAIKIDKIAVKRFVYFDSRTYIHNSLDSKLQFSNIKRVNKDIYDKCYPLVSVVVYSNDYNGSIVTLNSLLNNNYKNIELIFCGNISDELKNKIDELNNNHDIIQQICYVDTTTLNKQMSINKASKLANGKYLFFAYDWTEYLDYYISMCVRNIKQSPILMGYISNDKNRIKVIVNNINSIQEIKSNPFLITRDLFINKEVFDNNGGFNDVAFFECDFVLRVIGDDFSKLNRLGIVSSFYVGENWKGDMLDDDKIHALLENKL